LSVYAIVSTFDARVHRVVPVAARSEL
jgi:hypothetical protein